MGRDPRLVRLGVASAVALTTVVAAALGGIGGGSDAAAPGNPIGSMHATTGTLLALQAAAEHNENDLAVKNALSRSPEAATATDPTTDAQRAASEAYVESERAMPDPTLTTATLGRPRLAVPEDRYAMAGGCYTLNGKKYLFQATDLGSYLLWTPDKKFLGGNLLNAVNPVAKPSTWTDWTVQRTSTGAFTFTLANGKALHRTATNGLNLGTASAFALATTTGCTPYPEVDTDVTGDPFAGTSSFQEVRGYVDPHTHGMSHEFLGGRVICSPPWSRYGAPYALVDCPDHQVANGKGAVLDDFLAGRTPGTGHDPVGWPTFKDWPNPHSLTHQGVYWKWLERSWRGGLRVYTNLLVENNVLCELYPLKKNSCNDMQSIRRQAKDMWKLQDYIDAQYGGPGRGWYRIVTDPFQAREVINSGKLAVIMGIETSVPFGCNVHLGKSTCTQAQLDAGLAEVKAMGVRQMEITNKFDNALTGVAGDDGTTGTITNLGNFINTGSFLQMKTCPSTNAPDQHDKLQGPLTAPDGALPQQDAIFGAIGQLYGLAGTQPLPAYPPGPHCNARGLTDLGKRLLNEMIDNGILFDPDHMSVNGRNAALDLYEQAAADGRHPGILSSHSWSTPDAYPRIYKLGGFITPYAGDSPGFVDKWKQHLGWADPRYYFGFGYGADMNGFGAQGSPRGANATNPVTYPFTGLGGVTIDKGVSGQRVWDINTDGVAQYGLYPDWIEDASHVAGAQGVGFKEDMSRGAEAYLEMWERAVGVAPDSCRNAPLRKTVADFRTAVTTGMTTRQVLDAVGQPYERLGRTYTTCATGTGGTEARMAVDFSAAGVVTGVRRTA
ncbi:peptidase [Nocardioides jejuensis]|uniref:Peptidase n=1 Tax=Nocardioides jejuensis TaxID=2502782 RepID=A0A4R1CF09_9ACTN|nr:peptidase [Nocardioides jejuensis]TCJ29863.1 peptidase [Nocardioides jejuensis]